jgi:hypothetical protein
MIADAVDPTREANGVPDIGAAKRAASVSAKSVHGSMIFGGGLNCREGRRFGGERNSAWDTSFCQGADTSF